MEAMEDVEDWRIGEDPLESISSRVLQNRGSKSGQKPCHRPNTRKILVSYFIFTVHLPEQKVGRLLITDKLITDKLITKTYKLITSN